MSRSSRHCIRRGMTLRQSANHKDCRARSCNHTFADSFEKRDDWISVSRGSSLTNVSISLGMNGSVFVDEL